MYNELVNNQDIPINDSTLEIEDEYIFLGSYYTNLVHYFRKLRTKLANTTNKHQ